MERIEAIAGWLTEASETGNPLAPLPPELTPADIEEGEAVAAAILARMGLAPIGLRIGPEGVAGPVLASRLLPDGAVLALPALRHARATPALVAVLGADLEAVGDPVFAGLHPAIDVAASRFRDGPGDGPCLAADLAGLGFIVIGRRKPMPAAALRLTIAGRPAGMLDPMPALEPAIAAARRLGGLPAGTVLMAAGLGPATAPAAGEALRLGFSGLGRVAAHFA
jgi:2-keto-4-pentenoate hydratase